MPNDFSLQQACHLLDPWLTNPNRHCLDFRSPSAYKAGHLIPSTNIPLATLEGRFSQLPPKTPQSSFLVVSEEGAKFKGSGLGEVMESRGWVVDGVIELPSDAGNEVWQYATERGGFGIGDEGREYLFKPAPLLSTWIDVIEAEVHADAPVVMDIGCGSGRDLGFLAYRHLQSPETTKEWDLIGLDNWVKATERTTEMITSINPQQRRTVIQAEVLEDTGQINPHTQLDDLEGRISLVLMVRFFSRGPALFRNLRRYMVPGGFLLFSHFTSPRSQDEKYVSPPVEKRVEPGQVEGWLGEEWEIRYAAYSLSEDGRLMWDVVARWRGVANGDTYLKGISRDW